MAKRTKKRSKSVLKLEALEQRQLLAGVTGGGTEVTPGGTGVLGDVEHYIQLSSGQYDQVLMTGTSVSVTNDTGQVTRVSFLDLDGDIVQAEFSGAGTLTVSLDAATFKGPAAAEKYTQPGVEYVQGHATFTISGSTESTSLAVFSVGTGNAFLNAANPIFADVTKTGGDHQADVARLTIVADTNAANGSAFGSIYAGNAVFSGDSGNVGISAANVHVQNIVRVGDIIANGTARANLVFGANSQFGDVIVTGGGLIGTSSQSKINTTGSIDFGLQFVDGTNSAGTLDPAETTGDQLSFTEHNPVEVNAQTWTLTGTVDTFKGFNGKDTFNAVSAAVSPLDSLDGGGGADSLVVNDATGASAQFGLITVANIETLNLNSTTGLNGGNIDTSAWTGLTSSVYTMTAGAAQTITAAATTDLTVVNQSAQNISIVGGGGSLILQDGAGAIVVGGTAVANNYTSASIKGGTTVGLQDRSGAAAATGSSLTNVTLDGNTGASTITANGLTSLTLKNSAQNATVTAAAGTRALTLTLDTIAGGTIADAQATSVTMNVAGGAASAAVTLTAGEATGVTINADQALTLADVNIAKATGITITGDSKVTISATTAVGALTSINASTNTGGLVVTPTLGAGVAVTGTSVADQIKLGASTQAIDLGAGNDAVELTVNLGTGATLAAGDGTDKLTMTSTIAAAADDNTTFEDKISGFEQLVLTGYTTEVVNLANLDDINYVTIQGTPAGAAKLSGMAAGGTVVLEAASTALEVALADTTGTSDELTLKLGGVAIPTIYGSITASGVETLNIDTDDTTSPANGDQHTVTIVDTAATTIDVDGDAGLALTFAGTKLAMLDASGVTAGDVSYTSGALDGAVATLKGGAGNDTLIATNSTKAVTIQGGAGNDTLTANNALHNTINGGAGNDTITTGAGNDTITGDAGNDTINAGNGTNNVNGGDGDDTITAGSGADTIDGGAGTDSFVADLTEQAGSGTTDGAVINLGATDLTQVGVFTATGKYLSAVGTTVAAGSGTYLFSNESATNASIVDTLAGIENVQGTTGADYIIGSSGANGIAGGTGADVLTGGAGADTFGFIAGDNGAAPSATVFDQITDYVSGTDIIDYVAAITEGTDTTAGAAVGHAAVASGVVSFNAADDTLAERLVAVNDALDDINDDAGATDAVAGESLVFGVGADSYIFISDGVAGIGANDVLIKLNGIANGAATNSLTIVGGNVTGLA